MRDNWPIERINSLSGALTGHYACQALSSELNVTWVKYIDNAVTRVAGWFGKG